MNFEIRPVIDNTGKLVVHDIFIDDVWIGSRRTMAQCSDAIVAHAARVRTTVLSDLKEGSPHRGTIEIDVLVRR